MDSQEQKKLQLATFLKRTQSISTEESVKPTPQAEEPVPTLDKVFNNINTQSNNNKVTLNNFILNLVKRGKKIYDPSLAPMVCYDTNKFTVFTPCKCGSRSFKKYFSTLNINENSPEEKYFLTEKDIIIVLRDPESRFYSGLLTSYLINCSPILLEEAETSVSELITRHTLGYYNIASKVKKNIEKRGTIENLYSIPFDNVNSYTNEIHEDNSNNIIDTIAHLDYLKKIIKPDDLYEKDVWNNEVSSYKYLLENSKVYDLDKWKRFEVRYY